MLQSPASHSPNSDSLPDTDNGYQSPLATAISLWRAGQRIGLDLFVQLQAEGFDVPRLERFYSAQHSPYRN